MSYAFWAWGFVLLAIVNGVIAFHPIGDVPWWANAITAVGCTIAATHAFYRFITRTEDSR